MVGVIEKRCHEWCGNVLKLLVKKVEMQFKWPNAMVELQFYCIFISFKENITVNNNITISDAHASWAKANIEEANALNHN